MDTTRSTAINGMASERQSDNGEEFSWDDHEAPRYVDLTKPRSAKRPKIQYLSIPNNLLGWVFLRLLKRWANKQTYKITVRGRTPRWYVKHWNKLAQWMVGEAGRKPKWLTEWARDKWHENKLFIHTSFSVPIKHSKRLGVYFHQRSK